MSYNWNWGIFFQTSPDGVHTYLQTLLLGTWWTLATALTAPPNPIYPLRSSRREQVANPRPAR